MSEIRLHNPELQANPLEIGTIRIIDASLDDLIDIGFLDSPTLPSSNLLRVLDEIFDQLGMTWKGDPLFWDPMDRNLGGGVFISNIWQEVV